MQKKKINSSANILIVDDTPENLRLLVNYLNARGYKVRPAPSGSHALSVARGEDIDLILLDIIMPEMNGYMVCEQLKADPRTQDIPVIFISALDDSFDKVKAFEIGGVDYISKPFEKEELFARVKTHLAIRSMQKSLAEKNARLKEEIEERKRTEEELKVAKNAAESANQAKSIFLSSMSHELHTPLNAILGYAQLYKEKPCSDPKSIRKNMHIIHESGKHLLTLINDILDISKIEAGKTELIPEDMDFHDFLKNIAGIASMRADTKNIRFTCEFDEKLPKFIRADGTRLRQVLLNLLGNAIKFTDQGSVLFRVQTQAQETKTILLFEVQDTGSGIPSDQLENIFLPFEQAGKTKQRAEEGTGLGLAISMQLVRLMGGKIHVESEVNQGSRFWFEAWFSASEKTFKEEAIDTGSIIGHHGRVRRILIVDDLKENRTVLKDILTSAGFEVITAETGAEALKKMNNTKPDLVFMDLIMPEVNGFEVAAKLRETPDGKNIPVIAVSAGELNQPLQEKVFAGFLQKPIHIKELYDILQENLAIDWIYDKDHTCKQESCLHTAEIIPPSKKELEELYENAMSGSFDRIRDQLEALQTTDEKYREFVHEMMQLCNQNHEQELMALIEQYMFM